MSMRCVSDSASTRISHEDDGSTASRNFNFKPYEPVRRAVAASPQLKAGHSASRAGVKCSEWFRATLTAPYPETVARLLHGLADIEKTKHVDLNIVDSAIRGVPSGSQWVVWVSHAVKEEFAIAKERYMPEATGSQFMYFLLMVSRVYGELPDDRPITKDWTKVDADLRSSFEHQNAPAASVNIPTTSYRPPETIRKYEGQGVMNFRQWSPYKYKTKTASANSYLTLPPLEQENLAVGLLELSQSAAPVDDKRMQPLDRYSGTNNEHRRVISQAVNSHRPGTHQRKRSLLDLSNNPLIHMHETKPQDAQGLFKKRKFESIKLPPLKLLQREGPSIAQLQPHADPFSHM
jgi:hypothetical protein